MMTIAQINKILATCERKYERQEQALEQTRREITAWVDLRNAKEQETKPKK